MFIDIDYNRTIKKSKLQLAKPNKDVTRNIYEAFGKSVSLNLGGIHELNFSIPFLIDDGFELVENPNVSLIKEKMLIKLYIGVQVKWFVVDEIVEDGDDSDIFNVKAFSLGFELSHKMIGEYETPSSSPQQLLTVLLEGTVWSIGTVAPKFQQMRRSFETSSETNGLDAVIQAGETFGALLDFDDETRKVSFKDISENGSYKGMSVSYGKLLRSINRTRTTDELVTRLYIYGDEDLTIHSVNPTGQAYVEDFSYFMYPFARDASRNVLASSHFMSDALCHALLDQIDQVNQVTPQIQSLITQSLAKQVQLTNEQTLLNVLKSEMNVILARLDTAKAVGNTTLIGQITTERNTKQSQINQKTTVVGNLTIEYNNMQNNIETLRQNIITNGSFTPQLVEELKLYTIEKAWRDSRYIDAKELYDDGLEKFIEMREPKVVINVDIENLFEMIEEQYYWDKLVLGDLIKIKYPQMKIENMARIIQMDLDFESGSISVTIANTNKTGDEMEQLKDLLSKSQSASTILDNSKYKWDKVGFVEDEIYKLLNQEWDANKRKLTAGVNNQIEVGNRGIIIKNPDFPNEVIIIQSGIIALSKDSGDTWKTAIKPDGIVAERLIGQIIAGQNLIITNGRNSFTFDNDGFRVKASDFIIENADATASTFDQVRTQLGLLMDEKVTVVDTRLTLVAGQIRQEVSTTVQRLDGSISLLESSITTTSNRISLIVSETNAIRGDVLVSAINLLPEAIKISAKNIEFNGTVSFEGLDQATQDRITGIETNANTALSNSTSAMNTVDGWRVAGRTTINGGNIETGTIDAIKIKTEQLIVGQNVTMGANARITWSQVSNPPTAESLGGLPSNSSRLTNLTATGLYTGIVEADSINASTLSAISANLGYATAGTLDASNAGVTSDTGTTIRIWAGATFANRGTAPFRVTNGGAVTATNINITGGNITGSNISVTTDIRLGRNLYLGNTFATTDSKVIYFNGQLGGASIQGSTDNISVNAINSISLSTDFVYMSSNLTYEFSRSANQFINTGVERGYCGVGGMTYVVRNDLSVAGTGVSFRARRRVVPSSVSLAVIARTSTQIIASVEDIRTDGFWLWINGGTTTGYKFWRGFYNI